MKTYLVNLDKNPDRLAFMDGQLRRLGIEYERIPAIYGKALTTSERKTHLASFRARLTKGAPLSDGELGCALSHIAVYCKMISTGCPVALVLEDDVLLSSDFHKAVINAASFINESKPQVILFSAYGDHNASHSSGIERVSTAACTDAYMITRAAAEIIVKVNTPVAIQADAWTRWGRRHGLELYRSRPATAQQDNDTFGTDIGTWTKPNVSFSVNGTGRTGINLICFRARRVLEKFLDWIFWKVSGK